MEWVNAQKQTPPFDRLVWLADCSTACLGMLKASSFDKEKLQTFGYFLADKNLFFQCEFSITAGCNNPCTFTPLYWSKI
jgi:hypothetical protein